MLQFRKAGYTRKEIKLLHEVIQVGCYMVVCETPTG